MSIFRVVIKFKKILSRHQYKKIIQLSLIMILGGFLEMCSVSAIFPFMNCMMNPDALMTNKYIQMLCSLFAVNSSNAVLLIIAIILAVLYFIKNIYLIFQYNYQYRFVYNNMFEMQSRLFESYLNRSYEYYLNINSAEIIRIITSDTVYAFNTLVILLQFFAEIVVSGMLIITLFAITPSITIFMAILFVVLLLMVNSIIKPILRKAGRNQQVAGTGMNKWLLQSLQGIKDLKVTETEKYFKEKFDDSGYAYTQALRKNQTFSFIPRFIIEGISLGAIFIYIAVLIGKGEELQSIIPTLSAVAMSAIRLLPSVNRIATSFAQVEYNETMVDRMIENMKVFSGSDTVAPDNQYKSENKTEKLPYLRHEISFDNISYRYPNTDNNVLDRVNIKFEKNTSIGIIGPSGAGKSTAVDLLLGLLEPGAGRVLVDGVDIKRNIAEWHARIGYIPQTISMLDDSIKANIAFGVHEEEIDENRVWQVLKDASLDEFVRGLPEGIETQIGERGVRISGGQRQRIGIARALYRNPEVLIFDEATSALDGKTEAEVMDSIYGLNKNKIVIIIAHRLSTLDRCDCIYKVENGRMEQERSAKGD